MSVQIRPRKSQRYSCILCMCFLQLFFTACIWKPWITEYMAYFAKGMHFAILKLGILIARWSKEVGIMGICIFQSENLLDRYYLFPATGWFYEPGTDCFSK